MDPKEKDEEKKLVGGSGGLSELDPDVKSPDEKKSAEKDQTKDAPNAQTLD